MIPFVEGANMENVFHAQGIEFSTQGADSILSALNKGGGALGGMITDLGEELCNNFGAISARGGELSISNLAGEVPKPPTFVSETRIGGGPQQVV